MIEGRPLYAPMNTAYRLHKPLGVVLRIPGGWRVRIPRIEAEPWAAAQIMAYLTACGKDANVARAMAQQALQQHYVHGYTNGLRECVWRRAGEYADMWPAHRIVTGEYRSAKGVKGKLPVIELRGFLPERIVNVYVPMQNMGSRGAQLVQALLAEMGRDAEQVGKDAAGDP